MSTTISPDEIEKFSRIADEWWDERGKFAPLHRINPTRISYIEQQVQQHFGQGLAGLKLLDIGCGGGLITEPMATRAALVTGLDASEKNIHVASLHAEKSGLNIDYVNSSAEAWLAEDGARAASFDVVLALEIIEHVADAALFVENVMRLAKPDGLVFFSTINRTAKAYALAIIGAEYVLRWLPRGTHDWHKFVKPSELLSHVEASGGSLHHLTGMVMQPITQQWSLNERDVSVNYLMVVTPHESS